MGRLDHAMINVLIAGTFTPICVCVVSGGYARTLLTIIWSGAAVNIVLHVLWIDAPKWLSAMLYIALGWIGLLAAPDLVARTGWTPGVLFGLGGLFYSVGAAVYALRRPDPVPAIFGYHEVFHALVIAAAVMHYAAVAFYVLPQA
jgi:hemolysin III